MSSSKVNLPPISNFIEGFQLFVDIQGPNRENISNSENNEQKQKFSKTDFFTPEEDLILFKTLLMYFGNTSIDSIPWSFWKIYRQATGSKRSDSSLYHHWNGSIQRKFGFLIKNGRLSECIRSTEALLEIKKNNDLKSLEETCYKNKLPSLVSLLVND